MEISRVRPAPLPNYSSTATRDAAESPAVSPPYPSSSQPNTSELSTALGRSLKELVLKEFEQGEESARRAGNFDKAEAFRCAIALFLEKPIS